MPDKTITLTNAIVGIGSDILKVIGPNDTISSLWGKIKKDREIAFDRFTLALDFLYAIKAIHYIDGLIQVGTVINNDYKSES